jgi:hypothetical protein
MSKRNLVIEEGSVEALARLQKQDEKLCRRLRAAIETGRTNQRRYGCRLRACARSPQPPGDGPNNAVQALEGWSVSGVAVAGVCAWTWTTAGLSQASND